VSCFSESIFSFVSLIFVILKSFSSPFYLDDENPTTGSFASQDQHDGDVHPEDEDLLAEELVGGRPSRPFNSAVTVVLG